MIKFPLFSLKFNLVKLPGLSGPTPPLMPICVAQTHMHTCTHACTWVYTTSLAFIVYGERVFLSSSLESNHQTVNYPYLLIPMLRKKKIPNAVKRKLGIIVYDRNVNFVKKKKMSVLPDASGLGCLIHLLSQQLQALCQTPHLLPCAVSISQNPIGACCRH